MQYLRQWWSDPSPTDPTRTLADEAQSLFITRVRLYRTLLLFVSNLALPRSSRLHTKMLPLQRQPRPSKRRRVFGGLSSAEVRQQARNTNAISPLRQRCTLLKAAKMRYRSGR